MDREQLQSHLHEQFQEPVFKETLTVIDGLFNQSLTDDDLINKLHGEVVDIEDKYPEADPYCVTLWCLGESRLVTYQEWLGAIDFRQQGENTMTFQVGQVVKNLKASHGPAVCIATITKIDGEKIFATLPEGGTYEYTGEDFVLATEQDIADAKQWAQRNAEMRNPGPLSATEHTYPWDLFDEDGVRIEKS